MLMDSFDLHHQLKHRQILSCTTVKQVAMGLVEALKHSLDMI